VPLQDDEPQDERRGHDEDRGQRRDAHLPDVEGRRQLLRGVGACAGSGARALAARRGDALGRGQRSLDAAQLLDEGARGREALVGVLLERAQDKRREVGRQRRVELARVARRLALVLDADGERRVALERDAAGRHLVEDDAQRVDVGAGVDGLALDLLGAHVLGRPDHDPGPGDAFLFERAGDAEIHDAGGARLVDHDVLRLEVAVDDALRVGLGQTVGDLSGDRDGAAGGHHADLADEPLYIAVIHWGSDLRKLFRRGRAGDSSSTPDAGRAPHFSWFGRRVPLRWRFRG